MGMAAIIGISYLGLMRKQKKTNHGAPQPVPMTRVFVLTTDAG
jgi:hypothetical protein